MADLITKSAFARLCGVSPAAITQAIARGAVVVGAHGRIDPAQPINLEYRRALETRKHRGPQKAPAPKRVKPPAVVPFPSDSGQAEQPNLPPAGGNGRDIDAQLEYVREIKDRKQEADIRRINASATKANVETATKMERLIERKIVGQYAGMLGAELRMRLVDLPARIAPQIVALVKSGADAMEIAKDLEAEIADAIRHAKEAAKIATLEEFADSLDA